MKKYAERIFSAVLASALLVSVTGCTANTGTNAAEKAKVTVSQTVASKTAGTHNPYTTEFRSFMWKTQPGESKAAGEPFISKIVLKKSSESKPLEITLPWQVFDVSAKLKDCKLTYNTAQTKQTVSPSLQLFYESDPFTGENENEVYTWSEHEFKYKGSVIENQQNDTWPLGIYDSAEAEKVITEAYDRYSGKTSGTEYAPAEISFNKIEEKLGTSFEKVIVQRWKRGAVVSGGESNGMINLTSEKDIKNFTGKLSSSKFTKLSAKDGSSEYVYTIYFKLKGNLGFYSWDDGAFSTRLGFTPQKGTPIGYYASPEACKVIDSYYK